MEAQALKATDAEQKQNQVQHQQLYVEKGVMLEPFVHQVGGHCCVLRFGEQTICKPLIPREHQFYKTLPSAVRKFTPQYRGKARLLFRVVGLVGGGLWRVRLSAAASRFHIREGERGVFSVLEHSSCCQDD